MSACWAEQRRRSAAEAQMDEDAAPPLHPRVHNIWLAIANHVDDKGYGWPGLDTLCDMTGSKIRAVQRALLSLEAEGLIFIERKGGGRRKGGEGNPNGYWFLPVAGRTKPLPPHIVAQAKARVEELGGVPDPGLWGVLTPPEKGVTGDGVPAHGKGVMGDTVPAEGKGVTGGKKGVTGGKKGVTGDAPIDNHQEPSRKDARAGASPADPPPPAQAAPSENDREAWCAIRNRLAERKGSKALKDWVDRLELVSLDPPMFTVATAFMRDSILERYANDLTEELGARPVIAVRRAPDASTPTPTKETPAHVDT